MTNLDPTTIRDAAIRYRSITAARRELREELAPMLAAARPLGWSTLAGLTRLPSATVRRLAATPPAPTFGTAEPPPTPPLHRATLLRLTRAGRRMARLTAEQRELRDVLGVAIREMRARGVGWREINNTLGGRHREDVGWVRVLAREPTATGRPRTPRPMTPDHLQALALGQDWTTLALLRVPNPRPPTLALLARRLERYDLLPPDRLARIAGVRPPGGGGGDSP